MKRQRIKYKIKQVIYIYYITQIETQMIWQGTKVGIYILVSIMAPFGSVKRNENKKISFSPIFSVSTRHSIQYRIKLTALLQSPSLNHLPIPNKAHRTINSTRQPLYLKRNAFSDLVSYVNLNQRSISLSRFHFSFRSSTVTNRLTDKHVYFINDKGQCFNPSLHPIPNKAHHTLNFTR